MSGQPFNSGGARVEGLFHAALPLTGAQRDAYLDNACENDQKLRQRVEALLHAAETSGGFLPEQPGIDLAGRLPQPSTATITERPGDHIGRYQLLEQIGAGGFGVVFKAEQTEPIRRLVALKIIKLGMDTLEVIGRFAAERQTLAILDHPNIAKVLEAGATETGRPYFVMELVDGIPITDYCDRNRLSTRARLNLFTAVCRAVQHAHTKGIIHRDIKPSNVLVTVQDGEGVPKLIDFGIAKVTAQSIDFRTVATAMGVLGTPAYMSPEQADSRRPDIDTRSDIYSLGVLLYELLTGQPPFEPSDLMRLALDEVLKTIREQEPPRPSECLTKLALQKLSDTALHRQIEPAKLRQLLRGDLDCIVMRCLEKSRTRRYESASSLAADVQRHLENQPIAASPPTPLYRFQKLARRNKTAFAAVTTLLLTAIGGGSYWWFLPGTLHLDVLPADTQIEIDGKEKAAGKMPLELKVSAGVHQLRFHKPEFADELRTIVVPHGGFAGLPHLALKHYQGRLNVDSSAPGTGIQFAGVDYFAQIKDQPADTGTYDLLGFGDEFFDVHHVLTIKRDESATDRFSLENGVSWKYRSPALQGECLIITNCPLGDPPVLAESTLDEILFLSSVDGARLGAYKASYGARRSLVRLDLGGKAGVILVSGVEEPGNGPVLAVFADSWPLKLLWKWQGPPVNTSEFGALAIMAVPNPGGGARMAVAGSDGCVRLFDGLGDKPERSITISDLPLSEPPMLAAWKDPGKTYLLALLQRTPTNARNSQDRAVQGVLADADTEKLVWRKDFGTNQHALYADVEHKGIPWIVLCNERGWQTRRAESGEQCSGGPLPGQVSDIHFADLEGNGKSGFIFEFGDPSLPILSVRPSDGSVLWRGPASLDTNQPTRTVSQGVGSRVAGHTKNGTLLVAINDSLVALAATTGKPLWQVNAKLNGEVVEDDSGNLYVSLEDQRLLCLDSTGATNWMLRLRERVAPLAIIPARSGGRCNILLQAAAKLVSMVHWPRQLWSLPTTAGLEAPPLLAAGLKGKSTLIQMLPGRLDSVLYGLDVANGRTMWSDKSHHLPANRPPTLAELDGDGVPEIVAIGSRYSPGGNRLIVLRAADGELVREPTVPFTGWISCAPAVADYRGIGKSDAAVSTWDHPQIIMIDGRSGEILWHQKTEQPNMGGVTAADLDRDGLPDVIATSTDGHVYALCGKNGTLLWKSSGTNLPSWSPPTVADLNGDGNSQVLVTTHVGRLAVLDGTNGSLLWAHDLAGSVTVSGRPLVATLNGRKIIIAPMGAAGVVALDWLNRQEIWRSPRDNPVIAAPLIADLGHDGNREVIIATTKGEVFVLRLDDGKSLWHERIGSGSISADPTVADLNQDGIDDLLIASRDFQLYAIDGRAIVSAWRKL